MLFLKLNNRNILKFELNLKTQVIVRNENKK